MATTDAKPGFRLPWSADRSEPEERAETTDEARGEAHPSDQEIETTDMIDTSSAATESAPTRKPNKFMADLTRAMQGAAEIARADTLTRFSADAKTFIEGIHASTALEATDLRKHADDDVASIREWSKAEIARIREETDGRIAHRKAELEREIDAHAASIEARIERVQRRVDSFEAEMAAFFERLIAEDDATRFAAMAESLPEPPPFDDDSTDLATEDATAADVSETAAAAAVETIAGAAEIDQTDEPAERAVVLEPWPETPVEVGPDGTVEATDAAASPDPRLEALSLVPDFAAAEAEAAQFAPEESSVEADDPMLAEESLSARLAGLLPDAESGGPESLTTRVVVTGLVSVASIAGFKRQLSRVPGVQSVGVSSGPDGEFVFAVAHGGEVVLRDDITTLPDFGARVTAEAEGELTVAARDPEAEG